MSLPEIDEFPRRLLYRFCPICAGPLSRKTDDHHTRLVCERDGWTHYPTANLAATVVIEHEGGIVLLKRGIEPDRGIWHLPIGHVEFGESPRDAALREGTEETGLVLSDPIFLDLHHGRSYGDPKEFYLVFCYRAVSRGGTLTLDAENEEIRICPEQELPALKWSSQRRALAAWRAWKADLPWIADRPLTD